MAAQACFLVLDVVLEDTAWSRSVRWARWGCSLVAFSLWLNIILSILQASIFHTPPALLPLALAGYAVPLSISLFSAGRLLRSHD